MSGPDKRSSFLPDGWCQRYGAWLLAIAAFALLFAGTMEIPLLDRDEPRFSQATREMIQRGEWVVPYFNAEYRFDKPVLTYWLMRVPYLLFGTSEWTARLHTVVSGVFLVLVTYLWGRQWYGARAGFLAGLGLLTCLQMMIHGRIAVADMPLILCIALSHWALWRLLYNEGSSRSAFWLLYGSMGIGFLAKGPLAIIVPLVSLLLYRFLLHRRPIEWSRLQWWWGIPLFLAIIAPWGLLALTKTSGLFWDQGMQYHVIDRGIEVFNERRFVFGFYFLTVWGSLFPWSLWLPAWIRDNLVRPDARQAFLVAWFLGPFLIFFFYATQLPHYILPGFPAFFLLLFRSGSLPAIRDRISLYVYQLLRVLFRLLAMAMLAVAFWIHVYMEEAAGVALIFAAVAFLLIDALLLADSVRRQRGLLLCGAFLALVLGWHWLGSSMRENSVVVRMEKVLRESHPGESVWAARFREPSLVFYGNRVWRMFEDEPRLENALDEMAPSQYPAMILLQRKEMKLDRQLGDWLKSGFKRETTVREPSKEEKQAEALAIRLQELGYKPLIFGGMNYARFTWVELELWTQGNANEKY
jgi:4-amino-4-deoxy-L-arabinose transferase-like glycosyltransferase